MEELCSSRKFHFPGYDGALPKALRTSRRRSAYQKKVNQTPMDLNCIELLATVAGQVLQGKRLREENHGTEKASANEIVSFVGRASTCQLKTPSVECQQLATPEKTVAENISQFENCQDFNLERTIEKPLDNMVTPSCFEGAGLPINLVCLQNSKSVLFADPNEANVRSCYREEANTTDVDFMSKGDGSVHMLTPELPEPGQPNKDLDSKENADPDSLRDTNANEEGSCMTLLRDASPQPLSSGSSDEAPALVHNQSDGLCCEHPVEKHLGFSQDLVRLKAKDDDDNFSDLVVPVTTLPQTHSLPSLENIQQLMQAQQKNKLHQKEASETEAKTKGIVADGVSGEQRHLHCLRHFSSQQAQGRKRRRTAKSSKVSFDPYKSRKFDPLDSDAKDTSVGSSPTTSKGSWRSVKRKSNGTVDCSPLKVNITSFRVPELSINLPETATVANLKRAVMEAAVNLLGGGLHVRVLHHGKRVQDENSTLVQMGIACKDRLDSLAFMLEPSGVSNTSMSIGESVFACPKGRNQHASWHPVKTLGDDLDANTKETESDLARVDAGINAFANTCDVQANNILINNVSEGAKLQQCLPCESPRPATAALIVHRHAEGDEPAGLMTTSQENLASFMGKRRTRRPFTVVEVEALVQAVELLGTGRWREVKQQVFSHARHRTYVDLKDKWKTLVHTARIAPHQRRGEPVPQELLDRVLHAHTYWAMQLAKQQEDMGI